jgi:hypothetical protein
VQNLVLLQLHFCDLVDSFAGDEPGGYVLTFTGSATHVTNST